MGRFVPLVLGALGAVRMLGAIAQDIPTCIPKCFDELSGQFAKFTCTSAIDKNCLCPKPDFSYGIRDCAAHCGANDANVYRYLNGAFCAGLLPAQPSPASPHSTAAQPAPASTPPTPSVASLAPTPTPASSTSVSPAATAGSTPTSAASAASPTPPAAASDSPGSGLSQASMVGIGVGVGTAVIALAGFVVCFLWRGRKRKPRRSIEISKPLPGSGRTYAARDPGSFEKYGNDIEMTSNRYEDMVPRQQPRTMV